MFPPPSPPIPIPPQRNLAWNISVDDLLVEIIKKRNQIGPVVIQKMLAVLKNETAAPPVILDVYEPDVPQPSISSRIPRTSRL